MRAILLLLLLPFAFSKVGIYAKDFSVTCYRYSDDVRSLNPETPNILVSYLRDGGFDVELFYSTEDIGKYDGIIVLGCTSMDPKDVERFLSFEGRLVVDARDDNPLSSALGVKRKSYPLEGTDTSSFRDVYVNITNGILLKHVIKGGPLVGYERMYYVGNPIFLPSRFKSGFLTPTGEDVLGIDDNVVVTGCFYCSDPLLLYNLVDWVEDGKIDFPSFYIEREITPSLVRVGGTFVDIVRVRSPKEMEVRGEYIYGEGGGQFCNFTPINTEFSGPEITGREYEVEARFIYRPEEPVYCYLPPVVLDLLWKAYKRTVILDAIPVTVSSTTVALPERPLDWIYVLIPLILLILLSPFLYKQLKIRRLKKRWIQLKRLIDKTNQRYMARKISKEVYEELITEYTKELQLVEGALTELGVDITTLERSHRPQGER